jgi:hypothetical protein
MTRLLVLVEGQSEEVFVKQTLAPHLQDFGVFVQNPKILWTKRLASGGGYRGGVSSWQQIKRDLLALLRDSGAWVTTLIDFYGLPKDFPGIDIMQSVAHPQAKVEVVQSKLAQQVQHPRFLPFLVLHEFEAWVFSDPVTVQDHFAIPTLADQIDAVVKQTGGPERINHGPATHPKARLRDLIGSYKETSDGPTLIAKIGLERIRKACPHFHAWVSRLESLGSTLNTR